MPKPTLGLDVHYHDLNGNSLAAKITKIWSDSCVNLTVFDDGSGSQGGALVQYQSVSQANSYGAPHAFSYEEDAPGAKASKKPAPAKPAETPAPAPVQVVTQTPASAGPIPGLNAAQPAPAKPAETPAPTTTPAVETK